MGRAVLPAGTDALPVSLSARPEPMLAALQQPLNCRPGGAFPIRVQGARYRIGGEHSGSGSWELRSHQCARGPSGGPAGQVEASRLPGGTPVLLQQAREGRGSLACWGSLAPQSRAAGLALPTTKPSPSPLPVFGDSRAFAFVLPATNSIDVSSASPGLRNSASLGCHHLARPGRPPSTFPPVLQGSEPSVAHDHS